MADLQWHEPEFTKASIKRESAGEGNDKKLGF